MKNKTINLSAWMFFKAIPAVLLLVYYGLCTWNGYDPIMQKNIIFLMSLQKKI